MFPESQHPPTAIDRIAPTIRPAGRAVMRQDWRHLLFLHWVVPAAEVRALLPTGLELDVYEGEAYVGLVPFAMRRVRPVGFPPLPLLSDFPETNVRTYVHVAGRDPGVWFFSLDAANPVAVASARAWFHLPYHLARMRLIADPPDHGREDGAISYTSERIAPGPRPASTAIRARPEGPVAPAGPGTLEHFLAERYLLYAAHRGRFYRGQVHHAPYPLRRAEVLGLEESLIEANGLVRPQGPPLAHYARGVDVEVFPLRRAESG